MNGQLDVPHARALAALEGKNPFDQLKMARALQLEVVDMERALHTRMRRTIKDLRAQGVTVAEISERTGLSANLVLGLRDSG